MKNSTTIVLPQWFRLLDELSLDERVMPRDVRTRWNSTYDMLSFAYEYKDAINNITAMRDMKLRDYEVDRDEWDLIRQLRDVLAVSLEHCCEHILMPLYATSQIFKAATLFFSRDAVPTIGSVIPAMDRIDEHLATAATNNKYNAAMRAALAVGKKTLNRYYDRTDHSEVYRIAMSMYFAFFFLCLPV